MTHWRKLRDERYIGSWDIELGKNLKVTIDRFERTEVTSNIGKKNELVLYFKEGKKGMIVNVTNGKIIQNNLKTGQVEEWVGKSITLYVAKEKIKGELIDVIRVKSE